MQKYGGFIPGIRPGRLLEYLSRVLHRITVGALFIARWQSAHFLELYRVQGLSLAVPGC